VWTDQSYIIASCGLNTDPVDHLYIATVGLLGLIEVEVVDSGIGYGFPEMINYNLHPSKVIRIRINIYGEEILKEYRISLAFAKIVSTFISCTETVTKIIAKTINSIKTNIKARKI